mgnify:CR=1 FL=1
MDQRDLEKNDDPVEAYHVLISGRVTGVGFRFFAVRKSEEIGGIEGWIRNIGYGQVEAVCQGNRRRLTSFLHDLSQGPAWGRVDDIKVNEIPVSDMLANFHIR